MNENTIAVESLLDEKLRRCRYDLKTTPSKHYDPDYGDQYARLDVYFYNGGSRPTGYYVSVSPIQKTRVFVTGCPTDGCYKAIEQAPRYSKKRLLALAKEMVSYSEPLLEAVCAAQGMTVLGELPKII